MDLLVSQESRRINLLAMYNLLPFFSGPLIEKTFNEIARLSFSQLDSYLYMRMSNDDSRFYSPSKVGSQFFLALSGKVRINSIEKISQRLETLKKEDSLQNIDIVEHFWQRMQETSVKLGI